MEATTTITLNQLSDLVSQIATLNIAYLGVCIAIILFAGGLFYLFNVKPMQESLMEHKKALAKFTKDLEKSASSTKQELTELVTNKTTELTNLIQSESEKIENLKNEAFSKIDTTEKGVLQLKGEAEKELKKLKASYEQTQLDTLWNEQYLWDTRKVYSNALLTQVQYVEKALGFGKVQVLSIWFDVLERTLSKLVSNQELVEDYLVDDLEKNLSKIEGHNDRITKVREFISKLKREKK